MRNPFLVLVMLAWMGAGAVTTARADLTLAVHPFKPPARLLEAFTPLARYLGEQLGEPVVVKISRDYQVHIDAAGRDEADLAYLGPVQYVKLREAYGAKPLLARQQIGSRPVFHGVIFVRRDSAIQKLADLHGKRFAFGEPHSTMSHLVPRYMLWQAGLTVDRLASHKFVGDHVNVALGVLAGDYDAGAAKEDVFQQYAGRGLRALATSAPFSDHVLVASGTMPAARLQRLRTALLGLHRHPQGADILNAMTRGMTALVPVQDSDYDGLREVLKTLRSLGVES